jgi:putative membrane protein
MMMRFLLRAAIAALGLWLATVLVTGFTITSPGSLVLAALVLGICNALVRPVLLVLTLPITVLTLGLFLLVVNAAVIGLTAWLVPGFAIAGFVPALIGSLIVSVTGWIGSVAFK